MNSLDNVVHDDPLIYLYRTLLEYGVDIEFFPHEINSKYKQKLLIRDVNGKWLEEIRIIIPGVGNRYIRWPQNVSSHPVIEYAIRQWTIEKISRTSSIRSIQSVINLIPELKLSAEIKEVTATEEIYKWAENIMINARERKKQNEYSGLASFLHWCVEEYMWAFDDKLLNLMNEIPIGVVYSGERVSLRDRINGPYTSLEVQNINDAINRSNVPLRSKVALMLCREYGLRPIQIALLREEDVFEDIGGYVIKIPSVKGLYRSSLRRKNGNFKAWEVTEDVYYSIKQLIEENKKYIDDLNLFSEQWFKDNDTQETAIPRPLFPRRIYTGQWGTYQTQLYLENPEIREYAFHVAAGTINKILSEMTLMLKIPSCKSLENEKVKHLKILAYRFRYSLGTRMVLDGRTPAEVAEALDHSNLDSVKHYFKFNADVYEYVSEAHLLSVNIQEAAARFSGRFRISEKNDRDVIHAVDLDARKVSNIGLCDKKTYCEFNPVINCYSCHNFQPYIDGDHESAKKIIIKERDRLVNHSSGPIKAGLDGAMRGVCEVIEVIKNEYAVN